MTSAPSYEHGMAIGYDEASKSVTVTFRGRSKALNGQFATERAARLAGESYCRCLGWNPKSFAVPVRSLFADRFSKGG